MTYTTVHIIQIWITVVDIGLTLPFFHLQSNPHIFTLTLRTDGKAGLHITLSSFLQKENSTTIYIIGYIFSRNNLQTPSPFLSCPADCCTMSVSSYNSQISSGCCNLLLYRHKAALWKAGHWWVVLYPSFFVCFYSANFANRWALWRIPLVGQMEVLYSQ